jgi:hypothetical protein
MFVAYYADIAVGVVEIFVALALFRLKDMLHIGIALSLLFFFNSVVFLIASQPLLAVLQLFVAIGGISTYFIIGVAALGVSKFKYARFGLLSVSALLLFLLLVYSVGGAFGYHTTSSNPIGAEEAGLQFEGYVPVFYIMTLMIFGAGLGSTALFKKIRDNR